MRGVVIEVSMGHERSILRSMGIQPKVQFRQVNPAPVFHIYHCFKKTMDQ